MKPETAKPNFTRSFVTAKVFDMTLLHEGVFANDDELLDLSLEAIQHAAASYTGENGLAPVYLKYQTPSGNHDFLAKEEAERNKVGYVERLFVNGDGWLTARILLNTAEAIEAVEKHGWRPSIGYAIAERGVGDRADGIKVSGRVLKIAIDHVLVTDNPKYKGVTCVTCDDDDPATVAANEDTQKAANEEAEKAAKEAADKAANEEAERIANEAAENAAKDEASRVAAEEAAKKPSIISCDDNTIECDLSDGRRVTLSELRSCYAEHNPKPDEIIINGKVVSADEAADFLKKGKVGNDDTEVSKKAAEAEEKLRGINNKILAEQQNAQKTGLTPFTV